MASLRIWAAPDLAAQLSNVAVIENGGAIVLSLILQVALQASHVDQHVGRRLIALVGILCQCLVDDALQLRWYVLHHF